MSFNSLLNHKREERRRRSKKRNTTQTLFTRARACVSVCFQVHIVCSHSITLFNLQLRVKPPINISHVCVQSIPSKHNCVLERHFIYLIFFNIKFRCGIELNVSKSFVGTVQRIFHNLGTAKVISEHNAICHEPYVIHLLKSFIE